MVSVHASKNFAGTEAVGSIRPKLDLWIDNLGKRLHEHNWQAMQFDDESGGTQAVSNSAIHELNKDGYRQITYEKTVGGVKCSLDATTDDRATGARQETSLFIGGSLSCGRSTKRVL